MNEIYRLRDIRLTGQTCIGSIPIDYVNSLTILYGLLGLSYSTSYILYVENINYGGLRMKIKNNLLNQLRNIVSKIFTNIIYKEIDKIAGVTLA